MVTIFYMKKFVLFTICSLSGCLAFIACNDEIEDGNCLQVGIEVQPDYYQPYDSALAIALRQLDAFPPGTRAGLGRTVREHYVYSPSVSTRATETETARFHVINFENNRGFAIVSADKRTTPVYAYSTTGNIDMDDAVQNSGVGEFMECAEQFYQYELESVGDKPLPPWTDPADSGYIDLMLQTPFIYNGVECVKRTTTTHESKGPLLTTTWHQGWPFNYFCPTYIDDKGVEQKYLAGCVPVAMGQIMAYHRHPANYGGYNFNWDYICSNTNITPRDTCKARLVRLIGAAAQVSYGPEGSGSNIVKARNAFIQMGYTVSQVKSQGSSTNQNIKSAISCHEPLYFRGANAEEEGHAWVVDGYQSTIQRTTYYHAYYPFPIYTSVIDHETLYYSCNFGWGGLYNGMYLNVYANSDLSNNIKYLHLIAPNN